MRVFAVVDDHHFKDRYLFYRFRFDDKSAEKNPIHQQSMLEGVRLYHMMLNSIPPLISDKVGVLFAVFDPHFCCFS